MGKTGNRNMQISPPVENSRTVSHMSDTITDSVRGTLINQLKLLSML